MLTNETEKQDIKIPEIYILKVSNAIIQILRN